MKFEETLSEGFIIAGISVRTHNADNKAAEDLGKLFSCFFSEQIMTQIPDKATDEVYCLYTDYESDFTGEYTAILGCKVSSVRNLPEGIVYKEIPAGKYHRYQSQGEVHQAVGRTWNHIWNSPGIPRAYLADFDVYGREAQDPANAKVFTFLSVI